MRLDFRFLRIVCALLAGPIGVGPSLAYELAINQTRRCIPVFSRTLLESEIYWPGSMDPPNYDQRLFFMRLRSADDIDRLISPIRRAALRFFVAHEGAELNWNFWVYMDRDDFVNRKTDYMPNEEYYVKVKTPIRGATGRFKPMVIITDLPCRGVCRGFVIASRRSVYAVHPFLYGINRSAFRVLLRDPLSRTPKRVIANIYRSVRPGYVLIAYNRALDKGPAPQHWESVAIEYPLEEAAKMTVFGGNLIGWEHASGRDPPVPSPDALSTEIVRLKECLEP